MSSVSDIEDILSVSRFQGGQSNPTYLIDTNLGSLVLRSKPVANKIKSAHAVDREYRVMSVLGREGVAVPEMLAYCDDLDVIGAEFYLMRFIDGVVHWDPCLADLNLTDRKGVYYSMADTLAQIHNVDIDQSGMRDFGKSGDYFQRQISRWSKQYDAAKDGSSPDMDKLVDWIRENPPLPSGHEAIIHGDYRLDNMIFSKEDNSLLAVIDWELSTIGDPLADISYQCMQWRLDHRFFGGLAHVDRLAQGIPDEAEYLDRYCQASNISIQGNWEHYVVYNYFRFAAILYGVARRIVDGTAANPRAKEMAALAEPVAVEGWKLAQKI